MANNKQTINIDNFMFSINNMLASKYILIDRRISDILLAIADTHEVYNLIAECMVNFDFKQEWKMATTTNTIKLPMAEEKRISFIFCLLNNLDDKNLESTQILSKYFANDSDVSPYELFCKNIIAEFGRLVCKKLGVGEFAGQEVETNEVVQVSQNADVNENDPYITLGITLCKFLDYITAQKKLKHCFMEKNDLIAVVSTFIEVLKNGQVEYFYSYSVTINASIAKNKVLKSMFAPANKAIDMILKG